MFEIQAKMQYDMAKLFARGSNDGAALATNFEIQIHNDISRFIFLKIHVCTKGKGNIYSKIK